MLYIVSTPIGNMQDVTLRALATFKLVDEIVCEDTRVTGLFLHKLGIKKPLSALNDFNEEQYTPQLVGKLERGLHIALVSDAGTPLISDPGFRLVREAKKRDIEVTAIPGANAVTTALSVSGLPPDKFLFLGFLPKNEGKKKNTLEKLKESIISLQTNNMNPTIIFFDTPHSIDKTCKTMLEVFGDTQITIARELTKLHEQVASKPLTVWIELLEKAPLKGEIVVLMNLEH